MQSLLRDMGFGLRMPRKNTAFTVAAILTLALGIGANTAIFTVTNALLLRPFPYRAPEQLFMVGANDQTRHSMERSSAMSFCAITDCTHRGATSEEPPQFRTLPDGDL